MTPQSDSQSWELLETLFHQAAELDPPQRVAFLDSACNGNKELRRELESLLATADRTLHFLHQPVLQTVRQLTGAEIVAGCRIGPYAVERFISEGGMGRVYLAARADNQYRQRVALKLMHDGICASRAMRLRFLNERQILANLNHPDIARLLDGGVTPEGLPYLVMEYVAGTPIHDYCRELKLDVEGRLRLFRRVCDAVDYAHRHLVIHRDIKPANILVTADGSPKLLDFGIAKLLDPDAGDAANATHTSELLMTPDYASPEQIRGEPVTTATDVYGLGALLYELLAGVRPFRVEDYDRLEAARMICEQDPPPPSTAAAANPATAPPGLRRIKGDLDRIVSMALRKEPARRYPSAAHLAADIDAYLNGYPLAARSPNWTYTATRFVRRHWAAVAAAALFVVALAGFGIGMGILARRATREQAIARREAEFLSGMFHAATPEAAQGRTVTARQLLDEGAHRIDRELAGAPEVRASLLENIASAYRSLGLYDEALPIAQRSYDLQTRLYGVGSPRTGGSLELLASLERDRAEYAKAEPRFERLVAMRRQDGTGTDFARALAELGECLYQQNQDARAESVLRQALALDRRLQPDPGGDVRNYLALLLERKGSFPESRQLLEEALEIDRAGGGPHSPAYANSLHNLASALIDIGDLSGAENRLREGLAIRREILGPGHPYLAYSLHNLGFVLVDQGRPAEAEPYIREELNLLVARYGERHPRTAGGRVLVGRMLEARGDVAAAVEQFQKALDVYGTDHPDWSAVAVFNNLAQSEFDRARYRDSERYARRSLDMLKSLDGGDSPLAAVALTHLAEARLYQGAAAEAGPLLREALRIRHEKYGSDHPAVAATNVRLGEASMVSGQPQAAEAPLREALRALNALRFPLPRWYRAAAESALGACLEELGSRAEGARLLDASRDRLHADPRPAFRESAPRRIAGLRARAATAMLRH